MTLTCFDFNFKRLEKIYGAEMFPPERKAIVLKKLRRLSDDEFSIVTDTIIGENRYAPTLKEFEKVAKPFLDFAYRREQSAHSEWLRERRVRNEQCALCDDTGFVSAIIKGNPKAASFSFRCHGPNCQMSQRYSCQNTAVWSQDWEEKFVLVSDNLTPHQVWQSLYEPKKILT